MPGLDVLDDLIDMCNSIIQPHFEYCSVFWGSLGFGLCEKNTEAPQPHSPYFILCKQWGRYWRAVTSTRLAISVRMHKTWYRLNLEHLRSRFKSRNDVSWYRLRNSEKYIGYSTTPHQLFESELFLQEYYVLEQPFPWYNKFLFL